MPATKWSIDQNYTYVKLYCLIYIWYELLTDQIFKPDNHTGFLLFVIQIRKVEAGNYSSKVLGFEITPVQKPASLIIS